MTELRIGAPNEKQRRFLLDRHRHIAYGGARGGGKSIFCEGITDESFLRLTFVSARAKRQQMEIFCRTKNCEKCELYTAINARYADD